MPTYQLLTDRTLAQSSAITPTTLIHIVTTGDTSQNAAGSSYKAELGQLVGLFSGGSVSGDYLPLSGGTVTGGTQFIAGLSANTISATTYLNLPINTDVFVTGGTFSAGTATFTNNTGGTFSVSGFVTGDTYVTGLTFNTGNYNLTIGRNDGVSFTDSLAILASDLTVTGGTYDPNTGEATFTNNTGGTFIVTGFLTGFTDTYVTGGTYSNGTATFTNTSGGTFNVSGFYTGDTTTITGATSVGTGVTIFDSVIDRDIKINSITGDTLEKITTSLSSNTIEVGINEQNLTLWDLVVQGNRLLSGNVSYISGLTFSVSPLEYLINGTIYDITSATTVTLNSGDSTYDRIDVIYADISGNTGVLEGTPSENPEKPIVDGDSQVEVTFVLVPANSTTANVNQFIIYNENSGPPSEWTFGAGGLQPTRISGDSTDTAYSGVTSIKVSGVTGAYTTFFRLTGSTILDTNEYATLQFAIKNLSANTTSSRIRLRFLSTGGTQNGNAVFMNSAGSSGYVQYSSTNTSTWQLISIPLWRFYLTNTNVQVLEVAFYPIGTGAQSRYYFDLIEFVEGAASSPPSNSWTKIKGDSATTITAPNPNATLTISGGTNIGSFISGTSTVVLNLDNNINLNGVTASTISATTYQNLPDNVTGNYLPLSGGTVTGTTNFTNGLSANTISATTIGNSGDCVDDIYVSNIHSCSPLNINPLDEGNVYFGSTSGVTIDLTNTRIGINTNTPQFPFQIVGVNNTFYYDPTSVGGRFNISGNTNIPRYDVSIGSYLTRPATGGSIGMRAWNDVVYVGYGKVGDMHMYAGNETYGLNIINGPGTNTEDYIRFYAGTDATSTSDIHIQGTGTTRGFVGLGIENPTAKLHVLGGTIITGTLTATTISATTSTITTSTSKDLVVSNPYVPTGSTDPTGVVGTISWSGNSIYLRNSTEWVRFTGETSW